jgi:hypothetical protein
VGFLRRCEPAHGGVELRPLLVAFEKLAAQPIDFLEDLAILVLKREHAIFQCHVTLGSSGLEGDGGGYDCGPGVR